MASDQGNDNKLEQILDAAEQSVRRFGIRKTAMGDVATKAKVSRATLYNYFSDKDQLVNAVLERASNQFCIAAETEVAKRKNLLDKVICTVLWCRKQSEGDLFLNISETEPATAALMAINGAHIQRCMAFWPEHIQLAIDNGELNPRLDTRLAADWIQRIVLSLVIFPNNSFDIDDSRQLRRYLKQHLIHGLSPH